MKPPKDPDQPRDERGEQTENVVIALRCGGCFENATGAVATADFLAPADAGDVGAKEGLLNRRPVSRYGDSELMS